jgi:hypothetical protein
VSDGQYDPEEVCANCCEFVNDPRRIERELPGLGILSSAHGDTLGDQGLCSLHQQLVTPNLTCSAFRDLREYEE